MDALRISGPGGVKRRFLVPLYFIAMRQAGETEAKAIERLTNFQVEMTAKLDYGSTKRMFAELITERFLENKGVKIM